MTDDFSFRRIKVVCSIRKTLLTVVTHCWLTHMGGNGSTRLDAKLWNHVHAMKPLCLIRNTNNYIEDWRWLAKLLGGT